jgi:hypothetical protein
MGFACVVEVHRGMDGWAVLSFLTLATVDILFSLRVLYTAGVVGICIGGMIGAGTALSVCLGYFYSSSSWIVSLLCCLCLIGME